MTNLDDKFLNQSVSNTEKDGTSAMSKRVEKKADGRTIIFYSFQDEKASDVEKFARNKPTDSNPEV